MKNDHMWLPFLWPVGSRVLGGFGHPAPPAQAFIKIDCVQGIYVNKF